MTSELRKGELWVNGAAREQRELFRQILRLSSLDGQLHQFRQSDDGIDRGAQLMGDMGNESGLHVGHLLHLPGLCQGHLPLGHALRKRVALLQHQALYGEKSLEPPLSVHYHDLIVDILEIPPHRLFENGFKVFFRPDDQRITVGDLQDGIPAEELEPEAVEQDGHDLAAGSQTAGPILVDQGKGFEILFGEKAIGYPLDPDGGRDMLLRRNQPSDGTAFLI